MSGRSRPSARGVRPSDYRPGSALRVLKGHSSRGRCSRGEGANHFRLEPDEVVEGRGAFLVAYDRGESVGCGAIRRLDAETAEIKRMYVIPGRRGYGVGRAVLAALEAEGCRLGVSRLVLETGERQAEALALYARAGFQRIPVFGEYIGSPLSVCMAKDISPDDGSARAAQPAVPADEASPRR